MLRTLEIVGATTLIALLVILAWEGLIISAVAIGAFLLLCGLGWRWIMRQ
ncbi:MAG: hypothetical protein ACJ735_06215 [Actinomycetes bacterium]